MTPVRPLAVSALLFAALVLTGCGSSDDGASAAATKPAQGAPSTPSDAKRDAQAVAGGDAPAGGATLVDAANDPAATITVTGDGAEPAETSVQVGSVVRITSGDGETHRVEVGDLRGVAVKKGSEKLFRLDQPGTYRIRERASGAAAVVTVD